MNRIVLDTEPPRTYAWDRTAEAWRTRGDRLVYYAARQLNDHERELSWATTDGTVVWKMIEERGIQ